MDTASLAEYIETKLCNDCRQGYTCNHFECEQGKKVADMLRKMEPFKGTDENGRPVSGWLIPE